MTCRYRMDLKGLADYLEAVVKAGQDVDAAAAKAVEAGGDVVLASMLKKVPVGTPPDPHIGNLKRHLVRTPAQQDGNVVFIDVGMAEDTDANTAIYGNVQEYGSGHVQAKRYIRGSFDENHRNILAAEKKVFKDMGVLP